MGYVKLIIRELQELDEEKDKRFLVQLYVMIRTHKERSGR